MSRVLGATRGATGSTTMETVVGLEDFPGQTVCTRVFVFALNLVAQFFTTLTAVLFATQVLEAQPGKAMGPGSCACYLFICSCVCVCLPASGCIWGEEEFEPAPVRG